MGDLEVRAVLYSRLIALLKILSKAYAREYTRTAGKDDLA
jgi:hypothetical protein